MLTSIRLLWLHADYVVILIVPNLIFGDSLFWFVFLILNDM